MKKKILLLSDDLRMNSGVATMSREIVVGTVHKYDWVQLGAANSHPELGKIIDINDDVRKHTGVKDAHLKIIPNNNFGDIVLLRKIIEQEKPDAILHFTDPHYWLWLYDNEHEIRQSTPILYYHVWDDLPDPKYNKVFYESCDWIGCISKQTYGIVNRVGKSKIHITDKPLEDWQIKYVPHGINPDIFKPIQNFTNEIYQFVHSRKTYDFVLFYNSRNIRRKLPSDIIYAFKLFCEQLPSDAAKKCLLLMHTNPIDDNGTDLIAVKNDLCSDYDILFTNKSLEQHQLNELYNIADCTINISCNEGFGLSTAESIMAGTPIIVNVTGGLQDQCGFNIDGKEFSEFDYVKIGSLHDVKKWGILSHGDWVLPLWPSSMNLNGSPLTPYIFDDRVNIDDVANAIKRVYDWGKVKRKDNGLKGRSWAINKLSKKVMCDKMIDGIDTAISNFKPQNRYEIYKIT